jgi:ATP synthase protein I
MLPAALRAVPRATRPAALRAAAVLVSPLPAMPSAMLPAGARRRVGQVMMSEREPARRERRPVEDNAGWSIFSYLISGMVFYGLVGWLVGRLTHIGALFPIGMLVGLVLAIVLIVYKYGRP